MTDLENPYLPPTTHDLLAPSRDEIRMEKKALVVPKGYVFPAVCVKTGTTDELMPRELRKFKWCNPALGVLIIVNVLIYLLIASLCSKRGEIQFQISRAIARKRRNTILWNWGLFLLSIGCFILGGARNEPAFFAAGAVAILTCLIIGHNASRFLWTEKVDKTHIWIRGIPERVAEALVLSEAQPG